MTDYAYRISEAFRASRESALREINTELPDDPATLAVRITALGQGLEDALVLISRQIEDLAGAEPGV